MKLTEEQRKAYYQARGIRADDLLSPDELFVADLPADAGVSQPDRENIQKILDQWNRLDAFNKIEAALAMEQRVLRRREPEHLQQYKRLEAWIAFLMLGRVRGVEQRRDVMQRVARGDLRVPEKKPRGRETDDPHAAWRERFEANIRAAGYTGTTCKATKVRGMTVYTLGLKKD